MTEEQKLMAKASALGQAGNICDAAKVLDIILARSPAFVPALNMRGMIHLKQQEYHAAKTQFENALTIEKNNYFSHKNLAESLQHLGQHKLAIDHFNLALKIRPDSLESIMGLSSALITLEKPEEALDALNKAIRIVPTEPVLHLNLGLINQRLGRFDIAIANFRKATSLAPMSPNGDICLGKLYLSKNENSLAETYFKRALQHGACTAEIEVCLSQALFRGGKEEQVLEHLLRAREIDPSFQGAYLELDNFLLFSGDQRKKSLIDRLSSDYIYGNWAEPLGIAAEICTMYDYPHEEALTTLMRFLKYYHPGKLHDRNWWHKKLGQFGGPGGTHDVVLRGIHSAVFSWSLPDSETLSRIAQFTDGALLRSYGAGSGFWERLLQDHFGVSILATDSNPRHRFIPVTAEDFSDATVSESDTVFLAWIVSGNTSVLNILRKMHPQQRLVLIGEPAHGQARSICASPPVKRFLDTHFDLVERIPLVSYSLLNDTCDLYRKLP